VRIGADYQFGRIVGGGEAASVGPPTVNVGGRVQENLVRAGLNLRLPIPH
jgi:hypothetical protein